MKNINISIIIINYNVAKEVDNCINSLINVIRDNYEILVVDNNSSDRDIELLSEKYKNVKFFFLKENLGFARANNYAVDFCKYENILFVNPDTIIIEDFITTIINFIELNPKAGACGPMLLNKDFSYQHSTGIKLGYIYEFCEAMMFIKILRYFYKKILLKNIKNNKPVKVSWLSAACLIMSKNVFRNAGGFNPDFFLNYEDIDLCERIRKAGFTNYYFPFLKCIHLDQKSQTKNLEDYVFNRYRGRIIYGKIHYALFKRKIINSFHIVGLILRIMLGKLFYSGKVHKDRTHGYIKALKLYFYEKRAN
jgi:hypothetical protein